MFLECTRGFQERLVSIRMGNLKVRKEHCSHTEVKEGLGM